MTTKEFKAIKSNAPAVIGAECEFTRFYPSCGKYTTERGIIKEFGKDLFEHHVIIGQRGKNLAIHYLAIHSIK